MNFVAAPRAMEKSRSQY